MDEIEIRGNNEVIYWMFGMIGRITKKSRVFCVLNNGTAKNLKNILKENIATNDNQDMDLKDEYLENTKYIPTFLLHINLISLENVVIY